MSESEQGYSSEDYEEAQYEQKSYLSQSNNSGQRYDAGQDNEEDHEIKAIINNVLHKHYKRSLEASRNNNGERIRKINDELEG